MVVTVVEFNSSFINKTSWQMAVERHSGKHFYWSRYVRQVEGKWAHQIINPPNHKVTPRMCLASQIKA